ncbi:hypothetical protein ElyMa_005806600 [Elysia marginata]|uniref:Uncharacterized protein n=1 Tax=Elysia marginata TaxID=1093978 RepID=A0AAV4FT82_9GAST|nr:hypothetical protein ElyMa_005806600 [Elysia marginata]
MNSFSNTQRPITEETSTFLTPNPRVQWTVTPDCWPQAGKVEVVVVVVVVVVVAAAVFVVVVAAAAAVLVIVVVVR